SKLSDAAASAAAHGGPKLPGNALSPAQDSVGAGLAVAKEVGKQVASGAAPKVGPEKAQALGLQQAHRDERGEDPAGRRLPFEDRTGPAILRRGHRRRAAR
ncbi:hypothetical protein ADL35_26670, partial [Streptomyces sp. NRRL WC-3753]